MRANRTEYLFSVNTRTPPTMSVDSGEEFTVEVRGAFDDVEDIRAVPTPFTPACDGHPLAPITGPIELRGAKPGDVVAIDLIELIPFGFGKSAILRDFGGAAPRVPGAHGGIFRGARRPRLVRRPYSASAQLQSRHDLDDAAGGLQAVLCRSLWWGF
jgi:acetamidase/formamidase